MNTLTNKMPAAFLFAALVSIAACRKKPDGSELSPAIDIKITSPVAHASFKTGDTVRLYATVNSPVELHGYTWTIRNKADNAVVATEEKHAHGKNIVIETYWVNETNAAIDAELELITIVDHDGDKKTAKVEIQLEP